MVADQTLDTDSSSDTALLKAAQGGDRDAFASLVQHYHPALIQLARFYTTNETAAAELARTTWQTVLTGLDPVDQNTTVKTWLFRTIIHQTRDQPSSRGSAAPFAATTRLVDDPYPGAVDNSRLKPATHPTAPLHWITFPRPWNNPPPLNKAPGRAAIHSILNTALETLSPAQHEVIMLRDILGWTAEEVTDALAISDSNQRALLHRARSTLRNQLEEHLTP